MSKPEGKQTSKAKPQIAAFRKAARELGTDESEANFDAALKKVARHKPAAGPKPKPVDD